MARRHANIMRIRSFRVKVRFGLYGDNGKKEMETTIEGLGFRVQGLGVLCLEIKHPEP